MERLNVILPVLGLLWCAFTCAWKLTANLKKWRKDDYDLNHNNEWWKVVFANVISVGLVSWPGYNGNYLVILVTLLDVAVMLAFWFWLFFDGLYNVRRGFNWWYLGTDDSGDPNTDNFLQRLHPWQTKAIKIGVPVITSIIYLLLC